MLSVAEKAARSGGELLLAGAPDARAGLVEKSSATDVATATDKAIERVIVDTIRASYPDDGIAGEEGSALVGTTGRRWIIDPLDGTANFVRGLWPSVISIAVEVDGVLHTGVVFDPAGGDMFSAATGAGASLNGNRLWRRDEVVVLERAFIGISGSNRPPARQFRAELAGRLALVADSVRDLGSTALQLCAAAAGRLDAHIGIDVELWDMAAGVIVAREAGCVVEGFERGTAAGPREALVAPPSLIDAVRNEVLAIKP